eukprot:scaffold197762_cov15-Tisochrysis_lutea.AAC.1
MKHLSSGICRVKDHVQRNGYSQAVVVLSLGGPKARSLNEVVEDVIKVRACYRQNGVKMGTRQTQCLAI